MTYETGQVQGGRCLENRRAFTLVELLVVISIIALLLAVLMPALQRARNSAKTVLCAANEKQMGVASAMYWQANNEGMVPAFGGDWVADMRCWPLYLAQYIDSKKGAKTYGAGGYWGEKNNELDKVLKVFKCPSQKDPFLWNWYVRYGINPEHATDLFYPTNPNGAPELKMTMISQPSSRLYIADSMDTVPCTPALQKDRYFKVFRGQKGWAVNENEKLYPGEWVAPSEKKPCKNSGATTPAGDRHNLGANVLFLDGHTQWFKYEDIMFKPTDSQGKRGQKAAMWSFVSHPEWLDVANY